MFLVPSATSVIGIKYLYVDRAQNLFFSKMLRFRHQGYQIKALLKVDEEFQISDISKNHLRAENGMRNVSKFKFLAWISPFFHLKSKFFFLSLVKRTINLVIFFQSKEFQRFLPPQTGNEGFYYV